MVTLPPEFVATRYPGYFWNIETQELYSLKVGGVLMKLKQQHRDYWHEYDGYAISHLGQKRFLPLDQLMLLQPADSVIPVVARPPRPPQKESFYKLKKHRAGQRYEEPRV